jgi:hypothetical protein
VELTYWRVLIGMMLMLVSLPAFAAQKGAPAVQKSAPEVVWSDEDTENNELGSKQIIGMVEKVIVEPGNAKLDARIDTGANKTSMDAPKLQVVNEDGQDWALYTINGKQVRSKVVKYVRIKQHGAKSQRRPVIMLKITMGNVTQAVMTTLTDRSNFKYKILIGINYLKDRFIVDVSRKYVLKPVPAP